MMVNIQLVGNDGEVIIIKNGIPVEYTYCETELTTELLEFLKQNLVEFDSNGERKYEVRSS